MTMYQHQTQHTSPDSSKKTSKALTVILPSNNKPIAPKMKNTNSPNNDVVTSSTTSGAGNKRRNNGKIATFHHPTLGYAIPPAMPAKVQRRNLRERNRVKNVNSGYEVLKKIIPAAAKQKKMSKVDTLQHAVAYITSLQRMLDGQQQQHQDSDSASQASSSPGPCIKTEFNPTEERTNTPSTPVPPHLTIMQPSYDAYSTASTSNSGPLTPRTPDYQRMTPSTPSVYGNESGYETPSYFSAAASAVAPTSSASWSPQPQQQPLQYQVPPQPQQHYSPGYDPRIPTAYHENSEEDDLLDTIINWEAKDN